MTSDYKDHSLKLLKEMVDDSIQHTDATPKEVYDAIVNTTKEEIVYHKRCLERSENLLLLLKGNLSALYDKDVNGKWYKGETSTEDVWNRE